jgi:hypothetical protein
MVTNRLDRDYRNAIINAASVIKINPPNFVASKVVMLLGY